MQRLSTSMEIRNPHEFLLRRSCPPMAQNQTRNTHIVSRARKIWLCTHCLGDSIRLFADRFARCLLKRVYRYDVGVSSEAHSGDASLCECTYVCALADHDIDRQG